MSSKISDARLPGDFPMRESDWLLTQSDLLVAEKVLKDLSSGTSWQVVGNIRTDWPARRLRRRRGLQVQEIRVLLSERFDVPGDRAYLVDRISVIGFGPWRREGDYVKGLRFDAAEVCDAELVRDAILRMMDEA